MRGFLNWSVTALFIIVTYSSCVSVPNTVTCTASGSLSSGAMCADSNQERLSSLTFNEYLRFLEPQEARLCTPVEGFEVCSDDQKKDQVELPQRAGAFCMSSFDYTQMMTALEQACRALGVKCSYEVKKMIQRGKKQIIRHEKNY